jgi:hypothetical protein
MPYYMYVSLQDDDKIRIFTMDAERLSGNQPVTSCLYQAAFSR